MVKRNLYAPLVAAPNPVVIKEKSGTASIHLLYKRCGSLTSVAHRPSVVIEQATSSYSIQVS